LLLIAGLWNCIRLIYKHKSTEMNIPGNKYLADFGMAKAILKLESETSLTFTIMQKDGKDVDINETVAIKLTELRPQLFMATWKEKNGNTITQVQDYENGIVYANWTLPTGEFINRKGTLNPV